MSRLLIDADACPTLGMAVDIAHQHKIECLIICDTSHVINDDRARTITVGQGADSVDFVLVNLLDYGDIVVTQDYGLAAMCLARGARVINQNGLEYTNDNIDSMLFSRHIAREMRKAGQRTKGPSKRSAADNKSFAAALKQILSACQAGPIAGGTSGKLS